METISLRLALDVITLLAGQLAEAKQERDLLKDQLRFAESPVRAQLTEAEFDD